MELEFDVSMTLQALYDYNMYHTYTSPSGILGTAAGALFLVVYASDHRFMYLLAALVLILYTPVTLFTRSWKHIKLNPVYKKPYHVRMDEEGVTITQGEQELQVGWEDCMMARSSNQSILLYTGKKLAWIFPKASLKENKVKLIEMISTHMPPEKVKIKQ